MVSSVGRSTAWAESGSLRPRCPRPGGALHVRNRCHQVERLSLKCNAVKKAHGAHGDVDAGGCQLALLDEMVQPARDFLVGDQLW
jgi:hypothetical protein